MISVTRSLVRNAIDEMSGIIFADTPKFNKEAKIFFEDRYFTIANLLPELPKNAHILEVGLSGGILALLLKKVYTSEKIDTLEHPVAIKKYIKKFHTKLKNEHIDLTPVDLCTQPYPWPKNHFDLIVFSEVMEHLIPADIPKIFKELRRIMKDDGYLLVTTPNIASLLKRLNLLRGKNPVEYDLGLHEGATYGHIREYSRSEIEYTLSQARFTTERSGYYMIDIRRNIFTRIEAISMKARKSFGNNVYVLAKKTFK